MGIQSDRHTLIREYKGTDFYIINIEGPDVSGKETLSKKYFNILSNIFESKRINSYDLCDVDDIVDKLGEDKVSELSSRRNTVVEYLSFPRYETQIGKMIKEMLTLDRPMSQREKELLREMYLMDMLEAFDLLSEKHKGKLVILVSDRFTLSNWIYASVLDGNVMSDRVRNKLRRKEFPKPSHIVFMTSEDEMSKKIHKELLNEKIDKDNNEKRELQEKISEAYEHAISKVDRILCSYIRTFKLPIGYWTNNSEREDLRILVSILGSLNYDLTI